MPQRCFDAVLKAAVELCHDSPTETAGHWVAHAFRRYKIRFAPALRTLGTAYYLSQPKGFPYLHQLICSGSSKGKGSRPHLPRGLSQHVQSLPQVERKPKQLRWPSQPQSWRTVKMEGKGICLRDHWLIDISFELLWAVSIAFAVAPLLLLALGENLLIIKSKQESSTFKIVSQRPETSLMPPFSSPWQIPST